MVNLDWLRVSDRRRVDNNRRGGVDVGVLRGGGGGRGGHAVSGILSLYSPFTDPASAVV